MWSQKFNPMICTSTRHLIHLPKIPSSFSVFNVLSFRRTNESLCEKRSLLKVVVLVLR